MGLTFVEGFEQGAASGFGEVRLGSAGSVEGEGVRPPLSKASTEQVWLRCRQLQGTGTRENQGTTSGRCIHLVNPTIINHLQSRFILIVGMTCNGINDHYSRHRMICNRG